MTICDASLTEGGESLDALLLRYWLGEATPDERIRVDAWFAQKPERRGHAEQLYHGIRVGQFPPFSANLTAERTVRILTSAKIVNAGAPTVPRKRMASRVRYAFASAFIGLVALFGLAWQQGAVRISTLPENASVYTTANGERAQVTLPDGTIALLNVASRLEVPPDYTSGNRVVRLTGEALFTVVHNQGVPFTVATGFSTTRVLGTTFIVRQYENDTAAVVAVRDGKVSVGSTVLTAGHETIVGAHTNHPSRTTNQKRFAFADGVLFMDSRPLIDAIPELNRWYNVDIRLGDSTLATRRVTGSFEIGSVTDVMWILETTYNVRVVRVGRVVTLYPRG